MGHLGGEVIGQQLNVFLPLPQWRQKQDFKGQPIEQIGLELTLGCQLRQIGIGGGENAHIDRDRLSAADSLKGAVLNRPQNFFLGFHRNIANFVQKQGALMGRFKTAQAPLFRARKRACFVAEQLGCNEGRGQGGTIERDERAAPTGGEVVQARGGQLFASAAFANEQDGTVDPRGSG